MNIGGRFEVPLSLLISCKGLSNCQCYFQYLKLAVYTHRGLTCPLVDANQLKLHNSIIGTTHAITKPFSSVAAGVWLSLDND